MAFQPSSGDYPCYLCKEPHKWFKMLESDNPMTHKEVDLGYIPPGELSESDESMSVQSGNPGTGWKSMRVCVKCELDYRKRVHEEHPIGKNDPEWATTSKIHQDMKRKNKGEAKFARGLHYKAATKILEGDPKFKLLSKKAKAKAKTEKCYQLAEAFVHVVKNGKLFNAFMAAGNRIKTSEDLDKRANEAYRAYFADPDDPEKLRLVEEIEMEVAQHMDYQAANGDTEVLKALDHHSDMDPDGNMNVFDVCRRGVATQEI